MRNHNFQLIFVLCLGCPIVGNREAQSVEKEERILVWAIVATAVLVLVVLITVKIYSHQKRQADEYRQKITNLMG